MNAAGPSRALLLPACLAVGLACSNSAPAGTDISDAGSEGGSASSSGASSGGGSGSNSSGSSSGGAGSSSGSSGGNGADAGACADDGSAGAPTGAAQYPHLLDGYKVRSPCKVAGVDYRVGINSGKTLSSPTTLTVNSAITVSNNQVRCTGAKSVVMDSIDFTGYTIYNGSDGCQNVTITNSKFACPNSWSTSSPYAFIADQLPGSFTIEYDEFYGDNCGSWPNNLSDPVSVSNVVFQYNLMQHMPERHVSGGGPGDVDYRYNLIDQDATQPGAHENYLQFGGGSVGNVVVRYNTTYNKDDANGAEGFQFYTNGAGSFQSITFTNNTMIALVSGNQMSMSYMVHGSCHSGSDCSSTISPIMNGGIDADNFFDPTGAYGVYYGGSFNLSGATWSNRGNVNMVTGAAVSP